MYKRKTRKYKLVRKPKGSHRAYKEWAPSVKILQQNINRILPELYMQLLEILPKFNSPTAFLGTLNNAVIFFSPPLGRESKPSPSIHPLVFPDIFPWLAGGATPMGSRYRSFSSEIQLDGKVYNRPVHAFIM